MPDVPLKLDHPPIAEAVLDSDCDFPPGFDLRACEEAASKAFEDRYPKRPQQHIAEHEFELCAAESAKVTARMGLQATQFVSEDKKRLVQIRRLGFSFNQLPPSLPWT